MHGCPLLVLLVLLLLVLLLVLLLLLLLLLWVLVVVVELLLLLLAVFHIAPQPFEAWPWAWSSLLVGHRSTCQIDHTQQGAAKANRCSYCYHLAPRLTDG
jgi:hypothetical protein